MTICQVLVLSISTNLLDHYDRGACDTSRGASYRWDEIELSTANGRRTAPTCENSPMLRWLTAGESHGPALVAILEGLPAGVRTSTKEVAAELGRRRLGYGRGARMKFEADEVEFLGGLRHGSTLGGPIAIRVGNTEWPKWERVMATDPLGADEMDALGTSGRNAPLTRPRPG